MGKTCTSFLAMRCSNLIRALLSLFALFETNTIPIMNHKYLRFKIHFHNCNSTFENHIRASFLLSQRTHSGNHSRNCLSYENNDAFCFSSFLLELRPDSRFCFYSFKILMCIFAVLSHFLIQNTAIIYVCLFFFLAALMLILLLLLLMMIMGALVLASFCQRFVLIFRFVLQLQNGEMVCSSKHHGQRPKTINKYKNKSTAIESAKRCECFIYILWTEKRASESEWERWNRGSKIWCCHCGAEKE